MNSENLCNAFFFVPVVFIYLILKILDLYLILELLRSICNENLYIFYINKYQQIFHMQSYRKWPQEISDKSGSKCSGCKQKQQTYQKRKKRQNAAEQIQWQRRRRFHMGDGCVTLAFK